MIDLDAIKERVGNTTPGPWEWKPAPWSGPAAKLLVKAHGAKFDTWEQVIDSDPSGQEYGPAIDPEDADAIFIAAARTDVPALVKEVELLQDRVERLRTAIAGLAEIHSPGMVRDELLGLLAGDGDHDVVAARRWLVGS